jgi:hypothetical protein
MSPLSSQKSPQGFQQLSAGFMGMSVIKALDVIQGYHEDPEVAFFAGFSGSPIPESRPGTAT